MEIRVIEAITIDIRSKRVVAKYLRIRHPVWTKNLSLGVVVCVKSLLFTQNKMTTNLRPLLHNT